MVLHTSPKKHFGPSHQRPTDLMDRFVPIGELLQALPTVNFHFIPNPKGSGTEGYTGGEARTQALLC